MDLINNIPVLGYGTWNRTGEETYQGVLDALEIGYRHIDTAQGYQNEQDVGQALKDSDLARGAIFLTTKVKPENFSPNTILPSVRESLEKLQTDQVDLLLLHFPSIGGKYAMEDYMMQFAEVYDLGLCKNIGLSNFTIPLLDQALVLLGHRKLLTHQVEIHPFLQNHLIVNRCKALGIPLTAYSPLARGAVLDNALLQNIANKHNATAAQISLAFILAEGYITIPAARKWERILENFNALNVNLESSDIENIRSLEANLRLTNGPWCPKWDV